MHTHEQHTTQQHIDDFNRRLQAMAQHQREACALLLAQRLRRDVEEMNQARPPEPLWLRTGRWVGRQWAALASMAQPVVRAPLGQEPPMNPPDEDAVMLVDVEYRVVESDSRRTQRPSAREDLS